MNISDLKYFVALADSLHFGKAAKACFVSQPSLSIQIKKLETSLGVELLERSSRSVMLTDIGKIIAEQARELLQQASLIEEMAKQAQDPFSGELNLGLIPTLTTYLLPHILPELVKTESFPKLSIYISEEKTDKLIEKVKQGKLDAALVSLPIDSDEFVTRNLFQEELLLAVPIKHALAKQKIISTSDLTNQALLVLEEGHCLRDQALAVYQTVKEDKKFSATSLEILRYMVISNIGVTLMPALACQASEGIRYLPFKHPQPKRMIGMIWRPSSPKRLLLEKLTEHIRRLTQF